MTTQRASMGSPTGTRKNNPVSHSAIGDPHAVTRRLQSELFELTMKGDQGCSAFPDGDSLFSWRATIRGAAGTVFEGLTFQLSLKFPTDYPYKAPTVKFETPCFHPNVDTYGNICLDILKEKWSAAYSVHSLLVSIRSLLGEPNNDSPLNVSAAKLWDNQAEYRATLLRKAADQGSS